MYYVLLYYPKFDRKTEENIKAFRRKYDPFVDSWKPHIPFIFSVACSEVEEEKLTEHIETVLKNWKLVLPPHNLIGCPCKKLVKDLLKKEPYAEIELRPEVCVKFKCRYLLKTTSGAYRCSRFMAELRNTKRKSIKQVHGTTLRMHKDKAFSWRFRKFNALEGSVRNR